MTTITREDGSSVPEVAGKTVKEAFRGDDENGYPCIVITFTDGTSLVAFEESVTGSVAVEFEKRLKVI